MARSDRQLTDLARSDQRALDVLYSRYRDALVRYGARFLDQERAQDVVQNAFAKAFVELQGDNPPREIKPWLYRVVHNLALNEVRRKSSNWDQLDLEHDGVAQPTEIVERRHRLQRTVDAINDLPERQRIALAQRELSGRGYDEIAADLKTSVTVVAQLIHRARVSVRNRVGALLALPAVRWMLTPSTQQADAKFGLAKAGMAILLVGGVATGVGVETRSGSGPDVIKAHASVGRSNSLAIYEHATSRRQQPAGTVGDNRSGVREETIAKATDPLHSAHAGLPSHNDDGSIASTLPAQQDRTSAGPAPGRHTRVAPTATQAPATVPQSGRAPSDATRQRIAAHREGEAIRKQQYKHDSADRRDKKLAEKRDRKQAAYERKQAAVERKHAKKEQAPGQTPAPAPQSPAPAASPQKLPKPVKPPKPPRQSQTTVPAAPQ